ncbi:MAG: DUF3253 domain-containing protein [Pseudomonadota bacterium]
MSNAAPTDEAIREAILILAAARAPKTLCPSEVARDLSLEWRALMPRVRAVAAQMTEEGMLCVTQKGKAVDPHLVRGPIRLSWPAPCG